MDIQSVFGYPIDRNITLLTWRVNLNILNQFESGTVVHYVIQSLIQSALWLNMREEWFQLTNNSDNQSGRIYWWTLKREVICSISHITQRLDTVNQYQLTAKYRYSFWRVRSFVRWLVRTATNDNDDDDDDDDDDEDDNDDDDNDDGDNCEVPPRHNWDDDATTDRRSLTTTPRNQPLHYSLSHCTHAMWCDSHGVSLAHAFKIHVSRASSVYSPTFGFCFGTTDIGRTDEGVV